MNEIDDGFYTAQKNVLAYLGFVFTTFLHLQVDVKKMIMLIKGKCKLYDINSDINVSKMKRKGSVKLKTLF